MDKVMRTRNFATVVYPESAPDNWIEIIRTQCIPALISPLHSLDRNEDGSRKKEHYHLMLCFDNVKTSKQAEEVFALVNGVGVEVVKSIKGYARYLCHLDNPEKAQYSVNDVISCAGADYFSMINLASSKYEAISEMMDYCIKEDVSSYAKLLYFSKEERPDWFRVLCDNGSIPIIQFLKSRYWEVNHVHNDRKGEELKNEF